jgi:hypothetical protein
MAGTIEYRWGTRFTPLVRDKSRIRGMGLCVCVYNSILPNFTRVQIK